MQEVEQCQLVGHLHTTLVLEPNSYREAGLTSEQSVGVLSRRTRGSPLFDCESLWGRLWLLFVLLHQRVGVHKTWKDGKLGVARQTCSIQRCIEGELEMSMRSSTSTPDEFLMHTRGVWGHQIQVGYVQNLQCRDQKTIDAFHGSFSSHWGQVWE